MAVINANFVSLVTQKNLHKSHGSLNTAINRLATGLRINSAKDDAAGKAIANRLSSSAISLNQAKRNTQEGISLVGTTEATLANVNHDLQRLRELTVNAKNGTNTQQDLDALQAEVDQILASIDMTAQTTHINGIYPLRDESETRLQVGMNDDDKLPLSFYPFDTKGVGLEGFQLNRIPSEPVLLDNPQRINTDQVIEFLGIYAPELVSEAAGVSSDNLLLSVDASVLGLSPNAIQPVHVVTDDFNNFYLQVALNPTNQTDFARFQAEGMDVNEPHYISLDHAKLSLSFIEDTNGVRIETKVNVDFSHADMEFNHFIPLGGIYDPQDQPLGLIADVDRAIAKLDDYRAYLGSIYNRLESTANYLGININNVHMSRSRIEDADYAVEMSNVTHSMILQNAGNATLAQANQLPNMAVRLLSEAF